MNIITKKRDPSLNWKKTSINVKRSNMMLKGLRRNLQEHQEIENKDRMDQRQLQSVGNSAVKPNYSVDEFYRVKRDRMLKSLNAMTGKESKTQRRHPGVDSSVDNRKKIQRRWRFVKNVSKMAGEDGIGKEKDNSKVEGSQRKRGKFYMMAKFVVLLSRMYKEHSHRVRDVLRHYHAMDDTLQDIDMFRRSVFPDVHLMFDVSDYKPSSQGKISNELRAALSIPPASRTKKDLHAIRVGLVNYPNMCQYPVSMKERIAERAWFSSYGIGNVILREGHKVLYFYFILSGSAVVVALTPDRSKVKRVRTLHRGEMFGESDIVYGSRRQSSIISREPTEFLVMDEKDYKEIFLTGGISDIHEPFIQNSRFLQGCPLDCLRNNPKKAGYRYFNKGTVMVRSSKSSDWLYFIKSGSCHVLLKLKKFDMERQRRNEIEPAIEEIEEYGHLTHKQQIRLRAKDEDQKLEAMSYAYQLTLPNIGVATRSSYKKGAISPTDNHDNTEGNEHSAEDPHRTDARYLARRASTLPSIDSRGKRTSIAPSGPFYKSTQSSTRRMSTRGFHPIFKKQQSTRGFHPALKRQQTKRSIEYDSFVTVMEEGKMEGHRNKSVDDNRGFGSMIHREHISDESDNSFIYVHIMKLSEGDAFGIGDDLYDDQPEVSLISNGAECLLISKQLYWDNIPPLVYTMLKDKVSPYPSLEQYKAKLSRTLEWEAYTRNNLVTTRNDLRGAKVDVHDARSGPVYS